MKIAIGDILIALEIVIDTFRAFNESVARMVYRNRIGVIAVVIRKAFKRGE